MKSSHSGIALVIGTKAELIKCMPLMLELQKQKKGYWFIHTGQHSLKDACEMFGIKRPDFVLSQAPRISTKFWSKINRLSILWSLSMVHKIRRLLKRLKPRYVIYHGDTMSTAVASMASSRVLNKGKTWKNVHLEAGLRSGSLFEPFPEEISRQISDRFSDILLAVSDLSEHHLERELKKSDPRKILKIGNTIIDSSLIAERMGAKQSKKMREEYALINIHRHENLRSRERLTKVVKIIRQVKRKALWPLHDNTRHFLEKYGLLNELKKMKNLEIMPLLNYPQFLFLLANCGYLLTDGGSIQEESLVFKKPCILLRKRTERQEGLSTGINFLTRLKLPYTSKVIADIEEKRLKVREFKNPYGGKGVSKKVLDALK